MTDLPAILNAHRAALLDQERAAASAMVQAYGRAWERIQAQLDQLAGEIAAARARGETIDRAWLARQERLTLIQRQVEAELRRFAQRADGTIRQEQQRAVAAAIANAGAIVRPLLPAFALVNTGAVEALVGTLGDGSPLASLLDQLAPQGAQLAGDALITGVVTGQNPQTIAREVRDALGVPLARALTISRTEVLRAYREATLAQYRANRDVVEGWVWVAAHSRRTCPVCLAMSGRVFPLDRPFASHPNCRCVPAPKLASRPSPFLPGPQWFGGLPADAQRAILGPAKFAMYALGRLRLDDLVGERATRYGPTRYELPLEALSA
jgi:SPP1 gp7 family putative phage head morphogenesis protein